MDLNTFMGACPHCGRNVAFLAKGSMRWDPPLEPRTSNTWFVSFHECPAPECRRASLWSWTGVPYGKGHNDGPAGWNPENPVLLSPDTGGRGPLHADVDPELARDYREASSILSRSPQMAGTLARRILQAILVRKGSADRKAQLWSQIDQVVASGNLPTALAQNLHHLRHLGNFGAHETGDAQSGDVIRPNVEVVSFYLDILEGLFAHYYEAPARAREARATVNGMLVRAGKQPLPDQ